MQIFFITFSLILSARAAASSTKPLWWCTASGVTVGHVNEQVWGSDHGSLSLARAAALDICRLDLSFCRIEKCYQRQNSGESVEQ